MTMFLKANPADDNQKIFSSRGPERREHLERRIADQVQEHNFDFKANKGLWRW